MPSASSASSTASTGAAGGAEARRWPRGIAGRQPARRVPPYLFHTCSSARYQRPDGASATRACQPMPAIARSSLARRHPALAPCAPGVLVNRTQPAYLAARLLGGTLGIERRQPGQQFFFGGSLFGRFSGSGWWRRGGRPGAGAGQPSRRASNTTGVERVDAARAASTPDPARE